MRLATSVLMLSISAAPSLSETLAMRESKFTVKVTLDRLAAELDKRGMKVAARIDHAANAKTVGMEMPPTEVLGKADTKLVSAIWETPTYPDYHWVARRDIDATYGTGFRSKLAQTIIGVTDEKLLKIFDRSKFITLCLCLPIASRRHRSRPHCILSRRRPPMVTGVSP